MSEDKEVKDILDDENFEKELKETEDLEVKADPTPEAKVDPLVDMCTGCSFYAAQLNRFLTCPACGDKMVRRRLSMQKRILQESKRKRGLV
jgi:hypothetical protein